MPSEKFGANCAILMPFNADESVDVARLVAHGKWVLENGVSSFTLFGTTGEGGSFGRRERAELIHAVLKAGIPAKQLVSGIMASAWPDAADMALDALDAGVRNVLVPPPYYFKNPTQDGVYNWYARFFDALGSKARDVILYTIPSVTEVELTIPLIKRLAAGFPEVVKGVKDSTGDWAFGQELIRERGKLFILIGNETKLAEACRMGAEGSISGIANLLPRTLTDHVEGKDVDVDAMAALVAAVCAHPVTPALKVIAAHLKGDDAWLRVRAPFVPFAGPGAPELIAAFEKLFGGKV
ncbi:MAG: dihydrodipicolinate synthase family protein [Methylobacteriaceae bacterium]|jgi:4-hydroxy-tetrahydrodipicolinate synthase|nr:dihydrodipicolinate synthase family protein [Methylobacteriaceae bacterium]